MTNPSTPDVAALRIAHLIECDGPGGAEHVVADLVTNLQAAGAHNVVFVPADGEGWLAHQLAPSGAAIEYFRVERAISSSCARSLVTAFRRHGIAIAHSHDFTMGVYGAFASRWAGVPHVITMHGGRYYAARLRNRVALRAAIALSARTLAVSHHLADQMSQDLWMSRSRIATILNGVRYVRPDRTTLRHELGIGPSDRLMVSVGRLSIEKGHRHLIDAMALLAARHPTLHLAISGSGPLAAALASQARELSLADRVHLLGLRSDVAAILAAADLFVLPSLSEGTPLALLEAMFAGCPIVATEVGGVAAALAHGEGGVFVQPGNAPALAAAVDSLLNDPDRARELGRRAACRAAAEYDLSRMIGRYVDTYHELLPGRRLTTYSRFGAARAVSS